MCAESVRMGCSFLASPDISPTLHDSCYQMSLLVKIVPCVSIGLLDTLLVLQYNHLVWKHLPAYHGSVSGHHFTTGTNQPCLKGNWPVVNSLMLLGCFL